MREKAGEKGKLVQLTLGKIINQLTISAYNHLYPQPFPELTS